MHGLTQCQSRVLEFIRSEVASKGYPPTYREISVALGFKSNAGARDHINALQKKGYIRVEPMLSRGIRILGYAAPHLPPAAVKIYDRTIAGSPPWPEEKVVAIRHVGRVMVGSGEAFGIRLGTSQMTALGLHPGDELVFQRGNYPSPQKVAAVLDPTGRILLGHVHHEGSVVRVVAPNGSCEFRYDAAGWKASRVLGTAVMMFRQIAGE